MSKPVLDSQGSGVTSVLGERLWQLGGVLGVLGMSGWMLSQMGPHGLTGFPLDDAWIHLVYARSVSESFFLAYNEGIASTGSTSVLWSYMLGGLHVFLRSTESMVWGVKGAGILLQAWMAWQVFHLARALTHSVFWGCLSAMLLGFSPALTFAAMSGMEVALGSALCLAGLRSWVDEKPLSSGVWLGLAGLARPEFAVACLLLLAYEASASFKATRPFRKLWRLVLPIVVCAALSLGWNWAVDGRPFPATYYAKAVPAGMDVWSRLTSGMRIVLGHAPLSPAWLVVGALGWLMARKALPRKGLLVLLCGMGYFAANLYLIAPVHESAFYHIRYLLPAVPLLLVGLIPGVRYVILRVWGTRGRPGPAATAALQVFGSLLLLGWNVSEGRAWATKYDRDCRNINEVQVALGRDIARALPREARVGTLDAGAIRYFGEHETVDLMGLNTPLEDDVACRSAPLDVLALMPAWVTLPKGPRWAPLRVRRTLDYQLTESPQMGTQVLLACESLKRREALPVRLSILGRSRDVCLACWTTKEVEALRESLGAE